jgi:hypothetical protein
VPSAGADQAPARWPPDPVPPVAGQG